MWECSCIACLSGCLLLSPWEELWLVMWCPELALDIEWKLLFALWMSQPCRGPSHWSCCWARMKSNWNILLVGLAKWYSHSDNWQFVTRAVQSFPCMNIRWSLCLHTYHAMFLQHPLNPPAPSTMSSPSLGLGPFPNKLTPSPLIATHWHRLESNYAHQRKGLPRQ